MKKLVIFLGVVFILTCSVWAETSPLTLEQAIQIAIDNNYSLQATSKRQTLAKEKVSEAKSAFYPNLRIESSVIKLNEPPSMELPSMGQLPRMGKIILGDDVIYDAKAIVAQPLWTGGKLSSSYKLAQANAQSAEYEYERVKNELILSVQGAYFGILKALKFAQIARDAVKQIEAHLQIVKNFYSAGAVAKVDVLRAEVQLANAKQNLIKAENGLSLAKAGFNQLLARNLNTEFEVVDILELTPSKVNLDDCLKKAVNSRPELKQMKANIEMLKQRLTIAKADNYPSVALFGNYDYQKGKTPEIKWDESWMAGIMVNWTLWDWKARKSRINQAEAELEAVSAQELLLRDGIMLEVKQAVLNLNEAEKNIDVSQDAIGQAEENLRITREMYKEGAATTTDVLDAQTLLTQAKTNYYQALYDYHLALAKLEKAIGGK